MIQHYAKLGGRHPLTYQPQVIITLIMSNNTITDILNKPFLAMQCWSTQGCTSHLNQEQQLRAYEDAIMFRGVGYIES